MNDLEWGGPERRAESPDLTDLRTQVADLRADVLEIKELLNQGKGALKVLQLLFYILGPIVLAIYWLKDHMK